MFDSYWSHNYMFGICHTLYRENKLISQRYAISNATAFCLIVHETDEAMQYKREFLQEIR